MSVCKTTTLKNGTESRTAANANYLPQNAKDRATVEFAVGVEELAAESSRSLALYLEDCVQFRILQHVADLLGQVQQLELARRGVQGSNIGRALTSATSRNTISA